MKIQHWKARLEMTEGTQPAEGIRIALEWKTIFVLERILPQDGYITGTIILTTGILQPTALVKNVLTI